MIGYLILGTVAGVLAGFFGVGGGIVIIPALIWIFHMNQHEAQGVSLAALVLPVGILGALAYYRAHPFPIRPALFIALGIFLGSYLGGYVAQYVPAKNLRVAFGGLLILAGAKMILGK
jgi:uncharacterized protein